MSATTPAIQGEIGTQRLGAALAAIALAIVVLVALVGLQATASRTTTTAPAAAPAPAPASLYDRGSASDSGKLSSPMFAVPAPHLLALPPVFDPSETSVGGGHGTRFAR